MSDEWPKTGSPAEIGGHVVFCVGSFLDRFPNGNPKNWDELKEKLFRWVQHLDPNVAFAGLLWILENERRYQYQLVAGELLDRASLKGDVPLPELLGRILPHFEESANTVPKFLCGTFGQKAVGETLDEMAMRPASKQIADKIKTMQWWIRGLPGSPNRQ
jgi:hypothetical protein